MTVPATTTGVPAAPRPAQEPWLATAVRVLVHGFAAAVAAWPLGRTESVVAAALGSLVGAAAGGLLARTRVRSPVLVLLAFALFAVAVLLRLTAVDSALLAPSLGPAGALTVGDALLFGVGAFALSAGVRALSARHRAFSILEAIFVALAFATLVVSHRQGAINRPFEVADPIISGGGDPTLAFLVLGAAAAAVVVVLLLNERSIARAAFHLAVVGAVLFLILGTTQMMGIPPPPPGAGGLGLRQDEEDRQGRERGGRRNNEELEFRDNYASQANQVPLAVVLFHDDYSPPEGVYYFRQSAFSQYNGRRLVMTTRSGVDADIATGFPSEPQDVEDAPPFGELRGPLDTTVALLADHIRPFGLESPTRFEPARNPDPIRFRQMYRVTSAVMTADLMTIIDTPIGDPEWSADVVRHYTDAPADPRYATLARRIVEEVLPEELREVPLARALALTHWLGENGIYSLRSGHAGADDPTADFLFGDRTGYCVHFAHAAVYMMRALGLPARVATGYAVDEAARQGGSALLLTGGASHAWPEIYVDGVGWVVFDVAPQTVLDPPPPPPDADLQRLLGELARGENPFAGESLSGDVRLLDTAGAALILALLWLGATLAGIVLLLFVAKLWRRAAPAFAGPAELPRVVYRAELDRLSEVDLRRRRGESREAFARRVARACPSLGQLTDRHVGARFGSRRATDRDELARLARALRAEIRAAFPWWRRALGAAMPWTFFLSR